MPILANSDSRSACEDFSCITCAALAKPSATVSLRLTKAVFSLPLHPGVKYSGSFSLLSICPPRIFPVFTDPPRKPQNCSNINSKFSRFVFFAIKQKYFDELSRSISISVQYCRKTPATNQDSYYFLMIAHSLPP